MQMPDRQHARQHAERTVIFAAVNNSVNMRPGQNHLIRRFCAVQPAEYVTDIVKCRFQPERLHFLFDGKLGVHPFFRI